MMAGCSDEACRFVVADSLATYQRRSRLWKGVARWRRAQSRPEARSDPHDRERPRQNGRLELFFGRAQKAFRFVMGGGVEGIDVDS